jgi:hypothetical protein
LRGIPNETIPIDGDVHRPAEPDIAPRAPGFAHVEHPEHRHEAAAGFHHLRNMRTMLAANTFRMVNPPELFTLR